MDKLIKRWCLKAKWDGIPLHRAGTLFPDMESDDIKQLYADIEENGQQVPVLMWNGLIVDGRHRAIVCDALGLALKSEDISDTPEAELYSLVDSLNGARRNITTDQKASVAAVLSRWSKEGRPARLTASIEAVIPTQSEAARTKGVSRSKVQQAAKVLRHDEGLLQEVHAGTVKLSKAVKMVEAREQAEGTIVVSVLQDRENDVFQNGTDHTLGEAGKLLASLRVRVKGGLPTVPNERSWDMRMDLIAVMDEIAVCAALYRAMTGTGDMVAQESEVGDTRTPEYLGKHERVKRG